MDIIFTDNRDILAGFTRKPDLSDVRREQMVRDAERCGEYVIRPCLVHGKHIERITSEYLHGKDSYIEIENCDGLITDLPGVTLTSTHGDCIPIYLYDPCRRVIGIAHAGWKGTKLGIAFELAEMMISDYGCAAEDICAVIGPGIDKCHFEVSEDVKSEFENDISWASCYIYPGNVLGKAYIDLKGINRQHLKNAGIVNVEVSSDCTYCGAEEYYSFRRCRDEKRMLAYIKIQNNHCKNKFT